MNERACRERPCQQKPKSITESSQSFLGRGGRAPHIGHLQEGEAHVYWSAEIVYYFMDTFEWLSPSTEVTRYSVHVFYELFSNINALESNINLG